MALARSVAEKPGKLSRIQTENRALITEAALAVFAVEGFRGATIDRIAERSGMSKANLLYYFPNKDEIYRTVLAQTLEGWLDPFKEITPDADPEEALGNYIAEKVAMSMERPEASRLFANEIHRGAPLILDFLKTELKDLVDEKASVIQAWIEAGKLAPVDPYHLIFIIWATTQHYADFAVQVEALTGGPPAADTVAGAITNVIFNGIKKP